MTACVYWRDARKRTAFRTFDFVLPLKYESPIAKTPKSDWLLCRVHLNHFTLTFVCLLKALFSRYFNRFISPPLEVLITEITEAFLCTWNCRIKLTTGTKGPLCHYTQQLTRSEDLWKDTSLLKRAKNHKGHQQTIPRNRHLWLQFLYKQVLSYFNILTYTRYF